MRNLILLGLMVFGINSQAQVSLKDMVLGEEYQGKTIVKTTVGDIKGVLKINLLEDKRIYSFSFKPSAKLTDYELQNFKLSVEQNYNIQLFKKNASQYYSFRNDIMYAINMTPDETDKSYWDIEFILTNGDLEKIKNERKEALISTDF